MAGQGGLRKVVHAEAPLLKGKETTRITPEARGAVIARCAARFRGLLSVYLMLPARGWRSSFVCSRDSESPASVGLSVYQGATLRRKRIRLWREAAGKAGPRGCGRLLTSG